MNRLFSIDSDEKDSFRDRIDKLKEEITSEQIKVMISALSRLPDAHFVGENGFEPTDDDISVSNELIHDLFDDSSDEIRNMALEACKLALIKRGTGPTNTGVIVAGFGKDDLFPTLVAYEIYGVVGNRLKYGLGDVVDIDRSGTRAKVIPFAQKEMVERFLYGLDEGIRRNVTTFCQKSVPNIREKILEKLEMSAEDAASLRRDAEVAERAFYDGLTNDSFDAIRDQSQAEIEDMVEFMPKPEMGRMAEALVNLTSIKRRVSRGMETVGGPIDVAIISRAEGFVWLRRKHYFPAELNSRFFNRKHAETNLGGTGDERS